MKKLITQLLQKILSKYKRGKVQNLADPTEDMLNVPIPVSRLVVKKKHKPKQPPKF